MNLDIDPYLCTFIPPWPNYDIAKPGTKVIIASDLSTHKFHKWAKLDGYFKSKYKGPLGDGDIREYNPKVWWEDGMQSKVAHVVHILTDDIDSGIFCGFCAQNHPDYFMLLGRLKDGVELTEKFKEAFAEFGNKNLKL